MWWQLDKVPSPLHTTSAFPDEGLTTAIMDMEKLKKMQQSVRIGM
jgi:hypothetical protein